MQHRIHLVPHRADLGAEAARRHWEHRHGELFVRTPGLLHYRQNRPVGAEWASGRACFCSETWYADRAAERSAYESAYYREVVATDEAAFLVRDAAWSAAVLGDRPPPASDDGMRILWFDATPPRGRAGTAGTELEWTTLVLSRRVPAPGHGRSVHVAAVGDLDAALELTARAEHAALVCRSVAAARPPTEEETT